MWFPRSLAIVSCIPMTGLGVLALLPSGSWPVFVGLFFPFDRCFECSAVAARPLVPGVAPAVRGTVMALVVVHGARRAAAGYKICWIS